MNAPETLHFPFAALLPAGLLLLVLTAGCAQDLGWPAVERKIRSDFPDVAQITTDSLAKRLDERAKSEAAPPRPVLLDVREADEYAVSHLPGARRVAPGAPATALDSLSRDTPIVTYCSVGYRSAAMAERLRAVGFTNVSNLKGSIFRWGNEGRPLYRGGHRVRAVHPYNRLWGQLLDDDLHAREPG